MDLQLIIHNQFEQVFNDRLEKSFISYLKTELLTGDNKYDCPSCGKKTDARRGARLEKLPEVMVCNLNRFTFDYTSLSRVKLNNFVSFPKVLNMNRFLK